ncbi:MAG: indolepyruvate ferredoxin oxidoreductase family protein [Alphaproteobacteria bacterium]|nr:indolepyruvate ferredoxin oxidoreductase family protein [Alphaproteobacteria bacterium SS10]
MASDIATADVTLRDVKLDDKYTLEDGRAYMTGTQALVRLPMLQRARDAAAGLNTAGFISGYRGSPLGALDQQLWQAAKFLDQNHIKFQPGVNEDLAATSVWGSQQVGLFPGAKYDGVFGMWYGKGPGVDRSGDVLKHANAAGTAKHGGVLALAGDDHACKSSTFPHQSEQALIAAMIPVLNPANVQEFIDLGLLGIAMSRYAGIWVGFKTLADTVDSSASVMIHPANLEIALPTDFELPPGGLNIRWPDPPPDQEKRLVDLKLPAVQAFARFNPVDRTIFRSDKPRIGIISTGKTVTEIGQTLTDLGISDEQAKAMGLSLYKVGMVWPLETEGLKRFAEGHEELLVIEEKRSIIETQVKDALYHLPADSRPRVIGKTDETGRPFIKSTYEFAQIELATAIMDRLGDLAPLNARERMARMKSQEDLRTVPAKTERIPYFCSGCPHNTSTNVPEGSRAMAGIGCHYMSVWMDRRTETFTQMGGEGTPWIGQAPFTETDHVFANLGDGTFYHSGSLAIRAAVAAKVNITYKLLYNDAVAMTGGQPVDTRDQGIAVPQVLKMLVAEGVDRIEVMTEELERYNGVALPGFTGLHHRDDLDKVQRELRQTEGVSILLYDQTCATEKRRRRKRGLMHDPNERIIINELVCEGCGDCGEKSNCLSVVPVETEFGRKRKIDQSTCNKDFSCVNGFCPSFVTVKGGQLRKPNSGITKDSGPELVIDLPEPKLPSLDKNYAILVTGVGGTGIVTVGALLGMAAHLEGRGISVLDQAGLAQKGGPVISHLRFGKTPEAVQGSRIPSAGADLILGCDLLVAAGGEAMAKIDPGRTHAVINGHRTITGQFTKNPDLQIPGEAMLEDIASQVGDGKLFSIDATEMATRMMGNSIATNLFMLGIAYQRGLIPVSANAIMTAIELNGVAVKMNADAFLWGRRTAEDPEAVQRVMERRRAMAREQLGVTANKPKHRQLSQSLDELIDRRVDDLTIYQNRAYADRYLKLVKSVRAAEAKLGMDTTDLAAAVARYGYKLMAYKDEYEVARLYSDGRFLAQLNERFEGDFALNFHLAPPMIAPRDERTGEMKKVSFGPWMLRAFGLLKHFKGLRGTRFDPFGKTEERKMERQLIADYEQLMEGLVDRLTPQNHHLAVDIASIPEMIRGYGHVKERHLAKAKAREGELLAGFTDPTPQPVAAE